MTTETKKDYAAYFTWQNTFKKLLDTMYVKYSLENHASTLWFVVEQFDVTINDLGSHSKDDEVYQEWTTRLEGFLEKMRINILTGKVKPIEFKPILENTYLKKDFIPIRVVYGQEYPSGSLKAKKIF